MEPAGPMKSVGYKVLLLITSSGVVLDLVNERGEQRVEHLQTAFNNKTYQQRCRS